MEKLKKFWIYVFPQIFLKSVRGNQKHFKEILKEFREITRNFEVWKKTLKETVEKAGTSV